MATSVRWAALVPARLIQRSGPAARASIGTTFPSAKGSKGRASVKSTATRGWERAYLSDLTKVVRIAERLAAHVPTCGRCQVARRKRKAGSEWCPYGARLAELLDKLNREVESRAPVG
jgi:hypothetical protein